MSNTNPVDYYIENTSDTEFFPIISSSDEEELYYPNNESNNVESNAAQNQIDDEDEHSSDACSDDESSLSLEDEDVNFLLQVLSNRHDSGTFEGPNVNVTVEHCVEVAGQGNEIGDSQ